MDIEVLLSVWSPLSNIVELLHNQADAVCQQYSILSVNDVVEHLVSMSDFWTFDGN